MVLLLFMLLELERTVLVSGSGNSSSDGGSLVVVVVMEIVVGVVVAVVVVQDSPSGQDVVMVVVVVVLVAVVVGWLAGSEPACLLDAWLGGKVDEFNTTGSCGGRYVSFSLIGLRIKSSRGLLECHLSWFGIQVRADIKG